MVPIEGDLAERILAYASSIPEEHTVKPESEPHVTALYGLLTKDPDDIKPILKEFTEIYGKLGPMSLFKNDEFHVLKIGVESPTMHRLNKRLRTLDYENDYPDYIPHVTIAYLKPDAKISGLYDGNKNFDGAGFSSSVVIFSDSDKKHTRLTL
jgi:2'-5' RNA ligase